MASLESTRSRYLSSMAEELRSQSTRVRDLIGDRHWLSDGHHKEYLLAALLRRHLPSGTLVSRGFVVSPHEDDVCSNEQDILIIDTTKEAPLFHQSDLAICFPRTVIAAISVKTTLTSTTMADVVHGLNSVRQVAKDDVSPRTLWCGGFFFEVCDAVENDATKLYGYLIDGLAATPAHPPALSPQHPYPIGPDMVCSSTNLVFMIDFGSGIESDGPSPARILGYCCHGMASAFFIAHLLDHVASVRGLNDSNFCDFAGHSKVTLIDDGRTITS